MPTYQTSLKPLSSRSRGGAVVSRWRPQDSRMPTCPRAVLRLTEHAAEPHDSGDFGCIALQVKTKMANGLPALQGSKT